MGELRRNPTQDTQTKFLEELKTASLLAPSLFDLEIKPDAFGHLNMYQVSYSINLKDESREKEMIDQIRCQNSNLSVISSRQALLTNTEL